MLSKKAQISIEVLTILSILVVGAIIFGVYYLSNINTGLGNAPKVEDALTLNTSAPSTQPGTGTEESITPAINGQFNINLSLDPAGSSEPNTNFNIIVELDNVIDMAGDINITTIQASLSGSMVPPDCNYGTTPIDTLNLDLPIGENDNDSILLNNLSCGAIGTYTFTITAKGIDQNNVIKIIPATIDKEIVVSTPPADLPDLQLYLNPEERTPQGTNANKRFGIDVNLTSFTAGTPYIKEILVYDENQLNPIDYCYYEGIQISNSGGLVLSSPIQMDNWSIIGYTNSYHYLLDEISCSVLGNYAIRVVVGLSGAATDDINTSIIKEIGYLNAQLELDPEGSSTTAENFNIKISVNNYNLTDSASSSDIQVTDMYVFNVSDPETIVPSDKCYYGIKNIALNGYKLSTPLALTKIGDDYNLLMTNFNCSEAGSYAFVFTTHDRLETITYDYNAAILKIIESAFDRCEYTLMNQLIRNASDLDCVRYGLSYDYNLTSDIDLTHTTLSNDPSATWYDDDHGWWPIGTMDSPFTGSLDGDGYSINNLYTRRNTRDYLGGGPHGVTPILFTGDIYNSLFLNVDDANFSNLILSGVDINGWQSGSLVYYSNNSNFENIQVTGNVISMFFGSGLVSYAQDSNFDNCSFNGNLNIMIGMGGGIIGEAENITLHDCSANTQISCGNFVGGLVGLIRDFNNLSIINNASSFGNIICGTVAAGAGIGGVLGTGAAIITNSHSELNLVNGSASVGGLCGSCVSIINSYATGDITSTEIMTGITSSYLPIGIGGLVGDVTGDVIKSYSTGNINLISQPDHNAARVGGLIGGAYSYSTPTFNFIDVNINDSYSKSNITITGTAQEIGGLIGYTMGGPQILNSYSTGNINITSNNQYVGGLIGGWGSHTTLFSYWNTLTSNQNTSVGGEGRTTVQMTFPDYPDTYFGWDFSTGETWIEDTASINEGYPYLNQTTDEGRYCYPSGLGSSKSQIFNCISGGLEDLPQMSPSKIAESEIEIFKNSTIPDRSHYLMLYRN